MPPGAGASLSAPLSSRRERTKGEWRRGTPGSSNARSRRPLRRLRFEGRPRRLGRPWPKATRTARLVGNRGWPHAGGVSRRRYRIPRTAIAVAGRVKGPAGRPRSSRHPSRSSPAALATGEAGRRRWGRCRRRAGPSSRRSPRSGPRGRSCPASRPSGPRPGRVRGATPRRGRGVARRRGRPGRAGGRRARRCRRGRSRRRRRCTPRRRHRGGPPAASPPWPAGASPTKERTSCESAAPNASSGNGRASAPAARTSAPGTRARQAAAKESEGSTAATAAGPNRAARTAVRAPGPHPTSSTGPRSTPAKSRKRGASCREYLPTKRS